MECVSKIYHKNIEILLINYAGSKPKKMITIFDDAKRLVLAENKHVLLLSVIRDTYLSPEFMNHVRNEINKVDHLIDKNAVIGLTSTQKWIAKGMNLWYKKQIHSFDSFDEALAFLVPDNIK